MFNIAQPCGWNPGPFLLPVRSDVVELVEGYGVLYGEVRENVGNGRRGI